MNKPTGFLAAFFGSCSGTAIFFRLKHHSWKRVIWHSLLISLVCGIVTGLASFKLVQSNAALLRSAFLTSFGNEVLAGRETIVPKRDPERPRSTALPSGGMLFYTGTENNAMPENPGAYYAIIWRPEDLTITSLAESEGMRFSFKDRNISRLQIPDIRELFRNVNTKRQEERSVDFSLLLDTLLPMIRIYFVSARVLWLLAMSWLYTGIFALMYRIFHASRLHNLTISALWKCGIYAGFPALAVASVWQILDLPFISYETVYMIGLLIYWMVVIARIETQPNPEEEQPHE